MAALRFGLSGIGGGGTPFGMSGFRRARWVAFRIASSCSRAWEVVFGAVMDLVAGSMWRGRRSNVASMVGEMW